MTPELSLDEYRRQNAERLERSKERDRREHLWRLARQLTIEAWCRTTEYTPEEQEALDLANSTALGRLILEGDTGPARVDHSRW
jgi:hypothetical protein